MKSLDMRQLGLVFAFNVLLLILVPLTESLAQSTGADIYRGIRRIRSTTYATWLLTDFDTAFISLDELEIPDRVNALKEYLQARIRPPRPINLLK